MELILRDFFSFAPAASRAGGPSSDNEVRNLAKTSKGLKVTFVASHAGMVNGNYVMYSPKGMKDSAFTWVWPQRKPMQIHHDNHADPIGRIISASYVPYSNIDVTQQDSLTSNSDLQMLDSVKALRKSGTLSQPEWKGIGELRLEAIITDSDAMEKILDGRYQSVSVTQRPKQAFCDKCGQDWIKEGPCEHERGEWFEDEDGERSQNFLIVGGTEYDELSYVNGPADPFAQHIDAEPVSVPTSDSVQTEINKNILVCKDGKTEMSFLFVDSINYKESTMPNKNEIENKSKVETIDPIKDETLPEETLPEVENKSTEDSTPEELKLTPEDALRCLFEDRDNLTGEMCDLLFDEMESLVAEDAKLSTKKRNSLPSSSFCGPGKSFPVNDCAHYTAAKRMISRYDGSGNKSKISECIERKGKSLGCLPKDETKDSQEETFVLSTFSDEQLGQTLLQVEKLMVDRGLKSERRCEKCDEKDSRLKELNDSLPEKDEIIKILRSEYKLVLSEHSASEDSHSETLKEFESVLKDSVKTYLLLTDKESSEEQIELRVNGLSFEDLKKTLKEIDIFKIISFIRSGLSREPEGQVDSNDALPIEDSLSPELLKFAETLVNIRARNGSKFATDCLLDWIRAGKLPKDFTLDKAIKVMAK